MKPDIQRAIDILERNYLVAYHDNDETDEGAKELCFALPLAIAALEQQDKEPCEYCRLSRGRDFRTQPCANGDTGLETFVFKGEADETPGVICVQNGYPLGYFDINHCPMCGRRLTEVEHGMD